MVVVRSNITRAKCSICQPILALLAANTCLLSRRGLWLGGQSISSRPHLRGVVATEEQQFLCAIAVRGFPDRRSGSADKPSRYPALILTVIHADERGAPKNRKKIEWKLLTDVPVQSRGVRSRNSNDILCDGRLRSSTDTQIRLEGRGLATADYSAIDESNLTVLHCELAHFLDDDAQSFSAKCLTGICADQS
ncbi:hypothetical protein ACVIHI_000366 [Bradyrhizobium sp. USDA 4524]|nr:hypothetical protein [Bradyrhizobium sp. USDA 4538]MCP1898826.1 hypothetical protein [Bradyrhizobium sp. USDA 4537]MCP1909322.1 hypothetical protein [Bradyrhizobium elkanii]MCP1987061.1 hypothetical protein [Bradyrhizobium sp. USDA 4539]